MRWDYAFYQMILETGALSYRNGSRSGDVKPTQNNFAGLGATGRGEPGESFKDVPTGVRAHLEHLLLYSGEKLDNPTAERTRKVQEWGVLTSWHAGFNRPITFADLAAKWAPGSGSYSKMLEAIADRFDDLLRATRPTARAGGRDSRCQAGGRRQARASVRRQPRQTRHRGGQDGEKRSALRARRNGAPAERQTAKPPPAPYKILNAPPEPDKSADEARPVEPAAKATPPPRPRPIPRPRSSPRRRPA